MKPTFRRDRGTAVAIVVAVLALLLAGSAATTRPAAALAPPAAPDATIQLESLLGHHSVLAADLMRSRIRGDDDLAGASEGAVDKNTDAIRQLIASLLGVPA